MLLLSNANCQIECFLIAYEVKISTTTPTPSSLSVIIRADFNLFDAETAGQALQGRVDRFRKIHCLTNSLHFHFRPVAPHVYDNLIGSSTCS